MIQIDMYVIKSRRAVLVGQSFSRRTWMQYTRVRSDDNPHFRRHATVSPFYTGTCPPILRSSHFEELRWAESNRH